MHADLLSIVTVLACVGVTLTATWILVRLTRRL